MPQQHGKAAPSQENWNDKLCQLFKVKGLQKCRKHGVKNDAKFIIQWKLEAMLPNGQESCQSLHLKSKRRIMSQLEYAVYISV